MDETLVTIFRVVGVTASGNLVAYTGKAGAEFVSENVYAAFGYYSEREAERRAAQLNRGTCLHGIAFHVESDIC